MKFTSEDLMKFMRLKVGDTVKVYHNKKYSSFDYLIYEVIIDESENVMLNCEQLHKVQISFLANKDYEIIQPKPTLTEDEKVILRNLPKDFDYVVRDSYQKGGNVYLFKDKPKRSFVIIGGDGYWTDDRNHFSSTSLIAFNHLFQFIKWEDEPYSIEELLKE